MRTRSDVTRNAILTAARDLFMNKGYASTTIEAIAAQAQVTKNTIYGYFPDKRSLFKGVIEDSVGDPWEFRNLLEKVSTTSDLRMVLIEIATTLNAIISQPDYLRLQRLVIAEILTQPDLNVLLDSGAMHRAFNTTKVILRTASSRDIVSFRDTDAAARRFIGGFLVSVYFDGFLQAEPKLHEQTGPEIADYVDDFLQNAVKPE